MTTPTSSVVSTSSSNLVSNTGTTSSVATSSTGLSSVSSSISSATTPTESKGCCATISSCITSVINSIRDCLAKLPLIGWIFARESTAATSTAQATSKQVTDTQLIDQIRDLFPEATGSNSAVVPAQDLIDAAKNQFIHIGTDVARMEAFNVVMKAANSTDEIVKQFYDLLPVDNQKDFREHIYIANNRNDEGHTIGYGDYMVHHQIRQPVVKQAVENYIKALSPVVSSAAVSSTGTGSGSTT